MCNISLNHSLYSVAYYILFCSLQAIQETLLPPSVHILPKKKKKKAKILQQQGINGVDQQTGDNAEGSSSNSVPILKRPVADDKKRNLRT